MYSEVIKRGKLYLDVWRQLRKNRQFKTSREKGLERNGENSVQNQRNQKKAEIQLILRQKCLNSSKSLLLTKDSLIELILQLSRQSDLLSLISHGDPIGQNHDGSLFKNTSQLQSLETQLFLQVQSLESKEADLRKTLQQMQLEVDRTKKQQQIKRKRIGEMKQKIKIMEQYLQEEKTKQFYMISKKDKLQTKQGEPMDGLTQKLSSVRQSERRNMTSCIRNNFNNQKDRNQIQNVNSANRLTIQTQQGETPILQLIQSFTNLSAPLSQQQKIQKTYTKAQLKESSSILSLKSDKNKSLSKDINSHERDESSQLIETDSFVNYLKESPKKKKNENQNIDENEETQKKEAQNVINEQDEKIKPGFYQKVSQSEALSKLPHQRFGQEQNNKSENPSIHVFSSSEIKNQGNKLQNQAFPEQESDEDQCQPKITFHLVEKQKSHTEHSNNDSIKRKTSQKQDQQSQQEIQSPH